MSPTANVQVRIADGAQHEVVTHKGFLDERPRSTVGLGESLLSPFCWRGHGDENLESSLDDMECRFNKSTRTNCVSVRTD